MRSWLANLIYHFLNVFGGERFSNRDFPPLRLLRFFLIQKILRINAHVPWPCHWSTKVVGIENIQNKGTRNPGVSMGCVLDGRNGIIFGKNVWVAPRVSIISMNHDLNNYKRYQKAKPIIIGDNCWIATNAVILPEVELGEHVIVAAGSVVTKSFKENNILVGGVPAKMIKKLDDYET